MNSTDKLIVSAQQLAIIAIAQMIVRVYAEAIAATSYFLLFMVVAAESPVALTRLKKSAVFSDPREPGVVAWIYAHNLDIRVDCMRTRTPNDVTRCMSHVIISYANSVHKLNHEEVDGSA